MTRAETAFPKTAVSPAAAGRAARRRWGAAGLVAALLFAAATPASAQWGHGGDRGDRGEGRGWGGRGEERGDRGGPEMRAPRGGGGGWRGEGGPPGRGWGGGGGWGGGYAPRAFAGPRGGYMGPSPAPGPGPGRAWRRGEVLPEGYRGATVPDPGRYHLRRPPNGYDWVGDQRNAYLMQRSTGLVLDSVPGAYDPPPPYRRRRP